MTPYVGADVARSLFQLVTTLGLLAATFAAMHRLLDVSGVAVAVLALPAAGLLVRTFIIMHDCAHSSFLPWRRANDAVGFVTGALTLTPYGQWRRDHALHHASSGDLDRRGHGDIPTLTVREYLARSPKARQRYRLIRHPAALLLIGPLKITFGQRFRGRSKATRDMQVASVMATNAAIAALVAIWCVSLGIRSFALVFAPSYFLAAMCGVWLFYVQHQFEDAYWGNHGEWDYVDAALLGSSYLRLPRVLQWFTGNIGFHHVHHLAPKIPNYRLQRCHEENAMFQQAPVITLNTGLRALRLALWDEDRQRLVRFSDIGQG